MERYSYSRISVILFIILVFSLVIPSGLSWGANLYQTVPVDPGEQPSNPLPPDEVENEPASPGNTGTVSVTGTLTSNMALAPLTMAVAVTGEAGSYPPPEQPVEAGVPYPVGQPAETGAYPVAADNGTSSVPVSSGQRQNNLSMILLIAGGLLLVAGVVWFIITRRKPGLGQSG